MSPDPRTLAATYFEAWKSQDFATLRSILADTATFRGPLGSADDAEQCVAGLRGMAEILDDIVIKKVFVDGGDVLTWFDLHTTIAPPAPTANWMQVDNGQITRIRVTFDARALAPPTAPVTPASRPAHPLPRYADRGGRGGGPSPKDPRAGRRR